MPEVQQIATLACRPTVGPIKPAHWYHLFRKEKDNKTDLRVGFFVSEVRQIATRACRPTVGPIKPAHWYHLLLIEVNTETDVSRFFYVYSSAKRPTSYTKV